MFWGFLHHVGYFILDLTDKKTEAEEWLLLSTVTFQGIRVAVSCSPHPAEVHLGPFPGALPGS